MNRENASDPSPEAIARIMAAGTNITPELVARLQAVLKIVEDPDIVEYGLSPYGVALVRAAVMGEEEPLPPPEND